MAGRFDKLSDRIAVPLLAVLALTGAYYRQPRLFGPASALLLILLLARYWSAHSLDRVRLEHQLSNDRAFPGDEVLAALRLVNDKLLPLPWVEVDEKLPKGLAVGFDEGAQKLTEDDRLKLAGSVSWMEQVTWRCRLTCRRRGIYRLGPARVRSGDPFGFFPRSLEIGQPQSLVVYPRLIPIGSLGLPPGFPLGDTRPERWIFEDPARVAGVRDFRQEDSFRRVHWKATARRQQLQVKVHEPTASLQTAIFLAVDSFPARDFELAVSVVASLAHLLIGQRHPVGLYINGGIPGSKDPVELHPGSSQEQLITILELLAGIEPEACFSAELLIAEVAPRLPWGASMVTVAGSLSEHLAATVHGLKGMGRRPSVILVGNGQVAQLSDGMPTYRVADHEHG